jgi:hypothetical protein
MSTKTAGGKLARIIQHTSVFLLAISATLTLVILELQESEQNIIDRDAV